MDAVDVVVVDCVVDVVAGVVAVAAEVVAAAALEVEDVPVDWVVVGSCPGAYTGSLGKLVAVVGDCSSGANGGMCPIPVLT